MAWSGSPGAACPLGAVPHTGGTHAGGTHAGHPCPAPALTPTTASGGVPTCPLAWRSLLFACAGAARSRLSFPSLVVPVCQRLSWLGLQPGLIVGCLFLPRWLNGKG